MQKDAPEAAKSGQRQKSECMRDHAITLRRCLTPGKSRSF